MRPDVKAEMHLVREMLQISATMRRGNLLSRDEKDIIRELAMIWGGELLEDEQPCMEKIAYDKFSARVIPR